MSSSADRIVWLIWVVCAALAGLATLLAHVNAPALGVLVAVTPLILLAFASAGALITWRHPGHRLGWLFLTFALLRLLYHGSLEYAVYSLATAPGALPAGVALAWLAAVLSTPGLGVLPFLLALYPSGRLLSPGWAPVAWLTAAAVALYTLLSAIAPGPMHAELPTVANPLAIGAAEGVAQTVRGLVPPLSLVLVTLAGAQAILRFRRAEGIERLQLKWFAYAAALVVVGTLAQIIVTGGAVNTPAVVAVPAAACLAILRYRLYDIDLIINRTVVYATLAAVLGGLFLVASTISGQLIEELTGQHSELVPAGAGLLVALAFNPARRKTKAVVDRVLPPRQRLALLFADIVGSTERLVQLGDEGWRERLTLYRAAVRRELKKRHGHEVDTAGDGFFATFESLQHALSCAEAIVAVTNQLGLPTRVGLHVGEVEMRGEAVTGLAVHAAARVMALAGADEILLSATACEALLDSGRCFVDRGAHTLRGVPGDWRVFSLAPP